MFAILHDENAIAEINNIYLDQELCAVALYRSNIVHTRLYTSFPKTINLITLTLSLIVEYHKWYSISASIEELHKLDIVIDAIALHPIRGYSISSILVCLRIMNSGRW